MTDEQREYERYKLYWMLAHGYTLKDLVEQLQYAIDEETEAFEPRTSFQSLFDSWEFGVGFGGEIWPCFNEYIDELEAE